MIVSEAGAEATCLQDFTEEEVFTAHREVVIGVARIQMGCSL
jgi:hypothetical protein